MAAYKALSKYCIIIDEKFIVLLRTVDVTAELLEHLVIRNLITPEQTVDIRSQETPDARVARLLRLLHGLASENPNSDEFLEKFLTVLREHGQAHAANIFQEAADSEPVLMSETNYGLLTCKLAELRKCIDPKWSGFLDILLREKIFSVADIERVNIGRTYDEMAGEIVVILLRKPDASVDKFINALNETQQEHASFLLTGEGTKIPMSDEHIVAITRTMDQLQRYLDTDHGLLEKLVSVGVLNIAQHDFIRGRHTYDDKAVELIHMLVRKPDNAFDEFINALKATGQSHCVRIIMGEGDDPLSPESWERLRELRSTLAANPMLVQVGFVDMLISRNVLAASDSQRLQAMTAEIEKAGYIIDLIARKSQNQFSAFVQALKESDQKEIAKKLEATEASMITEQQIALLRQMSSPKYELLSDMQRRVAANNIAYAAPPKRTEPAVTPEGKVSEKMQELMEILEDKGISISSVDKDTFAIKFRCYTPEGLRHLRHLSQTHELDKLLTEAYCPQFADKGLLSIKINISDDEFERCDETFRRNALMSNEHRDALHNAAQYIPDKIKVTDTMMNRLNLCKRRRQAVMCAEKGQQQIETLLDIVSRQPDVEFQVLVDAFAADGQQEVADYLVNTAAKFKEEQGGSSSDGFSLFS